MNIDLSNFSCFDEIQCVFPTINTRMKSSRQNNFKMNCSFPNHGLPFVDVSLFPERGEMWFLTRIFERKRFTSSGGDWEPFDCFHLCRPWKQMRENSFLFSNEVERTEGGLFGKTVPKGESKLSIWQKRVPLIKKSRPIEHPQIDLGTHGPSWWFLGKIINANENSRWYKCVTNWKSMVNWPSVDQVQIMIIKKSYKKKKLLKSTFIIINYDLDKKPCYSFEKKNYPK